MNRVVLLLVLLVAQASIAAANGGTTEIESYYFDPMEASGNVTHVESGDTFDVDTVGRVKLADIKCESIETENGLEAKKYTESWLLGKLIYLDLDDETEIDQDGHSIAVVFLSNPDGTLNASTTFNQILVDSDHASIDNQSNEFDFPYWSMIEISEVVERDGKTIILVPEYPFPVEV